MSFRDGPFSDIKVPLTWAAGGAVVLAIIAAVVLLLSDRRETLEEQAYGTLRSTADSIQAPVSGALSAPVGWARGGIDGVRSYFFAVSDNRRLKAENEALHTVRDELAAAKDVNERYEAMLGLKTNPPIEMISARSITDSRGPFANSRLVNVGRQSGVKVGYPVMSENGIVGRVVGVSGGVSRVLMLTDIASRTPVMIDRNNARAILTGDGGANPKLAYLRSRDQPQVGDKLVTSGDGGVMPRGLPVGLVVKGVDGAWRAQLSSDRAPIDYVRILKFEDFSQLAVEAELSAPILPTQMGGAIPQPVIPLPKAPAPAAAAPGVTPSPATTTSALKAAPTAAAALKSAPRAQVAAPKAQTPAPKALAPAVVAPKTQVLPPPSAAPKAVGAAPVVRPQTQQSLPQPATAAPAAKAPAAKAPTPKAAIKGPTTRSDSGRVYRKVVTPNTAPPAAERPAQ